MKEKAGVNFPLQPSELAKIEPGFNWQTEAWFNGQAHPIQRLPEQTEWVNKPGFVYQITPFAFADEAAREADGAHFVIPAGRFMNTVQLVGEYYKLRVRLVEGAGWLQAKNPSGLIFQAWLGAMSSSNRVFEFGKDWIVRFVTAIGYGSAVLEGSDLPKYNPKWEKVIDEGDNRDFWRPKPIYFPPGRW